MITQNFPKIKPTFMADFLNSQCLDPRTLYSCASSVEYFGRERGIGNQNMMFPSQEFENPAWYKLEGASIAAELVADPKGGMTARTLTLGTSELSRLQRGVGAVPVNSNVNFNLWIRSPSGSFDLRFGHSSAIVPITITEEWKRFDVNNLVPTGGPNFTLRNSASGGVKTVEIWEAQQEARNFAGPNVTTTTGPITTYQPIFSVVPPNTPFFPANPLTRAIRGIGMSGQVVNQFWWPRDFTQSSWTKQGVLFGQVAASPFGGGPIPKLIESTANVHHQAYRAMPLSGRQTIFVVARAEEINTLVLLLDNSIFSFDINAASYVSTVVGGQVGVMQLGGGWAVGWFTKNECSGSNFGHGFRFKGPVYTGNGRDGLYVAHAQLMPGDFVFAPVNAAAAQSIRTAVVASKNFAQTINPEEGTIYAEIDVGLLPLTGGAEQFIAAFTGAIGTSGFGLSISGASRFRFGAVNTGDAVTAVGSLIPGVNKIVATYNSTSISITANGGPTVTGTRIFTDGYKQQLVWGQFGNGMYPLSHQIRKTAYLPVEISLAEREALTK